MRARRLIGGNDHRDSHRFTERCDGEDDLGDAEAEDDQPHVLEPEGEPDGDADHAQSQDPEQAGGEKGIGSEISLAAIAPLIDPIASPVASAPPGPA